MYFIICQLCEYERSLASNLVLFCERPKLSLFDVTDLYQILVPSIRLCFHLSVVRCALHSASCYICTSLVGSCHMRHPSESLLLAIQMIDTHAYV